MTNNKNQYFCYSTKLRKFLDVNGVRFMNRGINDKSGHPFWVYRQTKELETLLKRFTEQKHDKPTTHTTTNKQK